LFVGTVAITNLDNSSQKSKEPKNFERTLKVVVETVQSICLIPVDIIVICLVFRAGQCFCKVEVHHFTFQVVNTDRSRSCARAAVRTTGYG
jgi:hypothetical protein